MIEIKGVECPLASSLEGVIEKSVKLELNGKYSWTVEKSFDLKIEIYNISGHKVPILNGEVLLPVYYGKVYSASNLSRGCCNQLNSKDLLSKLYFEPEDLFWVNGEAPIKGVNKDLERFSNNIIKGLSERDWNNLAMICYTRGLLPEDSSNA